MIRIIGSHISFRALLFHVADKETLDFGLIPDTARAVFDIRSLAYRGRIENAVMYGEARAPHLQCFECKEPLRILKVRTESPREIFVELDYAILLSPGPQEYALCRKCEMAWMRGGDEALPRVSRMNAALLSEPRHRDYAAMMEYGGKVNV
jgi:hypothetical protein